MHPLIGIILLTTLISLCVLAGALFLYLKKEKLQHLLIFLVSLSAGTLIGGAALHLLPEAAEDLAPSTLFSFFLISFTGFFLIEKLLHWRHCHKADCGVHTFGYMNLFGDSIHNFVDGLLIAGAYLLDVHIGITTTIAVAIHEIPQEIGDFGVLLYAGFEKKKALIYNYIVSLTVVLGGIAGYFMFSRIGSILPYLLPITAGGFIYIAASDLMPEIKRERDIKKSMFSFAMFIIGITLMYLVKIINH